MLKYATGDDNQMIGKPDICVLLNGWGGLGGTGIMECIRHNPDQRKIKVVCADAAPKPVLGFKADVFSILPRGDHPSYMDSLMNLCHQEGVDVMLPGSGPEIVTISKHMDRIRSEGIAATVDEYDKLRPLMDKAGVYRALQDEGTYVPKFEHVADASSLLSAIRRIGYPKRPVCFKPSSYVNTGGSRGFRILRSSNDAMTLTTSCSEIDYDSVSRLSEIKRHLDLLVMEYLPGREFSVYAISDNGKMMYCVPNLRENMIGPRTFGASTKDTNGEIVRICKSVLEKFQLSYNTNIQLKESEEGKLKLVEINPRMGGSIMLPAAAGINLPYMSIKMALGESIPLNLKQAHVRMVRYVKELFVEI